MQGRVKVSEGMRVGGARGLRVRRGRETSAMLAASVGARQSLRLIGTELFCDTSSALTGVGEKLCAWVPLCGTKTHNFWSLGQIAGHVFGLGALSGSNGDHLEGRESELQRGSARGWGAPGSLRSPN
jgi:hypothetical protein